MLTLFVVAVAFFEATSALHSCADYQAKNIAGHSTCLSSSTSVVSSGVSVADIQEILDAHNHFRRTWEVNGLVPTDLVKLAWNEDMALAAQKKAETCEMAHDSYAERSLPWYGGRVGQNIYMSSGDSSWTRAVTSWDSEKANFTYGVDVSPRVTGHFTQVVGQATHVGCGYAGCGRQGSFYYCNYYIGQSTSETLRPFAGGSARASVCGGNAEDGLCAGACFDKICENGGSLDRTTCQCVCTAAYTGERCDGVSCPAGEDDRCGINTGYKYEDCAKSWVIEKCPVMCTPGCATITTSDLRTPDGATCTFHGAQRSSDYCKGLTDESGWCSSQGGAYGCAECSAYYNIPTHCPVMCGLC